MHAVSFFLAFACILCVQAARPSMQPFIWSPILTQNGTEYPSRRQDLGLAYLENDLYLLGGVDPDNTANYATDVWALDTEKGTWNHTKLQLKRAKHCVAQNGSLVYIIGGEGNDMSSFASWNLTSGTWTDLPALPPSHNLFPSCAVWGSAVVVFGGCDPQGTCSDKIDLFWSNETNPQWITDAPAAPAAVGGASLNILQSGKSFIGVIIGGKDGGNITQSNVFFYNFTNKTWTASVVDTLPHLSYHTSVTTSAGNLIVFGGEVGDVPSGVSYNISVNTTALTLNVSRISFNTSTPSARVGHGALYAENRMLLYGGKYDQGESSEYAWQLVVEGECSVFETCGECLLAGCYWCSPNATPYCVAGSITPFIDDTCTQPGWNHSKLLNCRQPHPAAPWLVAVTVVVLVVIAILVIATYVVDYRKGKANSGVYEPIGL